MKYYFIIFLLIPLIALSQSNEQLTTTDTLNRNSDTLINLPILKTEQGSFRPHVKVFLDTYFTYNSSQAKGQKIFCISITIQGIMKRISTLRF
jgi:hypothetical protein